MKAVAFTIALLLSTVALSAQDRFTILAGVGVGSYKMEYLKFLHDESLHSYPGLKSISRIPSYLFYSGEAYMRLNKLLSLGVIYRLQSTGSKVAYSDYSGLVSAEQLIHSNNFGIATDFRIWTANRISISAQLRAYYGFTKYTVIRNLELVQAQNPYTYWKFEGKDGSILLNPDVTVSYRVWDNVFFSIQAGYTIDFKGKVTINEYQYAREVEFDWSGGRLGMSASYKF